MVVRRGVDTGRQRDVIDGQLRRGSQQRFVAVVLDPSACSRVECLDRGVEQCTHRLLRRSAGQRLAGGGKKALYVWLDGHARSHAGFCPPAMMERVMGIEPTSAAWEAAGVPLNYTRVA